MSLKGALYDGVARNFIEDWSQKWIEKWSVSEDDSTKWDRDTSTGLTFKSIFSWADEADKKTRVYGTPSDSRAMARAAYEKLSGSHNPSA